MPGNYFEDQQYDSVDFTLKPLSRGVYEGCVFINANLSGTDLSEMQFIDCGFRSCNLSMVKVINTTFNGVEFDGCKMLGINFETSNRSLFKPLFSKCILNYCSFYQCNLKKAKFPDCSFQEADFTETDLTGAVFNNCDLLNAKFERSLLEKADLRTAINYSIDPEINKVRKAKFSSGGIAGLLDKYDIVIE